MSRPPSSHYARSGNVLLLRYAGQGTYGSIDDLRALASEITGSTSDKFFVLVVVEPSAPPPSAADRAAIGRLWKTQAEQVGALSYALLGSGFAAAARRAVITGIQILARPPFPVHVDHTVEGATRWLHQQAPGQVNAAALEARVEALRAAGPA